jgi:outer membrane cobalamin receptor
MGATIRESGYLDAGPSLSSDRRATRRRGAPVHHVPARFLVRSILSALLLIAPVRVWAAGPVTGRILDPDGRPLADARVLLVSAQTVVASSATARDGSFELLPAGEGAYEIRVAAEGFRGDPVPVSITDAAIDLGSIRLAVSAVTESVVVSAAQVEVPLSASTSAVTVLTGEDLRLGQFESIADALRGVPGLTVAANGGRGALTSIFPRGGESDYSLVFVDGVQANAFGGGFDFAHLTIANIDRLEVVRGPQSALFGANAIGSVVRVVTRRGGPPSLDGSIEGGSFGTLRLALGSAGSRGRWSWGAAAERLESDGLAGETAANGETVSNDRYERGTAALSAGWRADSGATVRGDFRADRDERGAPGPFGSDPGGTFAGIARDDVGTNDRWMAALGLSMPLPRALHAQALVTHARVDGNFTSVFAGSPSVSENSSRRTTARVQLDGRPGGSFETSAGAELLGERAGSTFFVSDGDRVAIDRSLVGIFAEARWSRAARLFVTAGLRTERIVRDSLPEDAALAGRPALPSDTVVSTNPKIAAAWYVRSAGGSYTRLRASAGTGIRPPDGFELAFTDNPSLKPERSRSADAGVDVALAGGRVLLESTAFFNRFDDLIVAVGALSGSSRYRTDNISNAQSRGLELSAAGRARAGGADLHARIAYTWLDTEILAADGSSSAPGGFEPGDRLLRRPAHQVALDVAVRAGRIGAFVRAGGRGLVRDVDPTFGSFGGVYDAPGYIVWDGGASWTITRSLELIGRVTNLLDRAYEESLGYPAPGRGVFAGVRVAAGR